MTAIAEKIIIKGKNAINKTISSSIYTFLEILLKSSLQIGCLQSKI